MSRSPGSRPSPTPSFAWLDFAFFTVGMAFLLTVEFRVYLGSGREVATDAGKSVAVVPTPEAPKEIPVCPDARDVLLSIVDLPEVSVEARTGCWSGWFDIPAQTRLRWRIDVGHRWHVIQYRDGRTFEFAEGAPDAELPASSSARIRANRTAVVSIWPLEVEGVRRRVKTDSGARPSIPLGSWELDYRGRFSPQAVHMRLRLGLLNDGKFTATISVRDEEGQCGRLFEVRRDPSSVTFMNSENRCGTTFVTMRPEGREILATTWGYSVEREYADVTAEARRPSPN